MKYDLHLLGWHDFQKLCHTILREVLGQTVSQYLDGNDAGKDGAFVGTWKQKMDEDLAGKFVFQCKFTNRREYNLKISDLDDEFEKISKLVEAGQCEVYILITNAGVSGRFENEFKIKLQEVGVSKTLILGANWLCSQINENKRLRMLVPRIYGLGDLSQILDERAYSQAKQHLTAMREDISKVVITEAYSKAASAINEHGFVLIVGEAASGKTTIASLLALGAADQWGLNVVKAIRAADLKSHWNPDDPNQFFWIDDAFGALQYEYGLANDWNQVLTEVRTMLRQGIKIVMTSRDYIYRSARKDLKESAFPLFNESQVVVDVQKLSLSEKEQILYNHLKLGSQPISFIKSIKHFLPEVAKNPRFIPETARRLADPSFTGNLRLSSYAVKDFVEKQEQFLIDVIKGLDKHSKAALALIYINKGYLPSPITLAEDQQFITRLGSTTANCIEALEAMKGGLVRYSIENNEASWQFKHPTIGDAYALILAKNVEQLEIYLYGANVEKMLDQITCGDVGVEHATIISQSLFDVVIERIKSYQKSEREKGDFKFEYDARQKILLFLSRRASIEFIELYLERCPELLVKLLKPTSSFYYSKEIELLAKLHESGSLEEQNRLKVVEHIRTYTENGIDLSLFKDFEIQSLFTGEELESIKTNVKALVVPKLNEMRIKEEADFGEKDRDTAEEHMEDFSGKLSTLIELFDEDKSTSDQIWQQLSLVKSWVDEHEYVHNANSNFEFNLNDQVKHVKNIRSIFDDIDATV